MMIRKGSICYFLIVGVWSLTSISAIAQTGSKFVEDCFAEVSSCQGVVEAVNPRLLLVDAWGHHDLQEAYKHSLGNTRDFVQVQEDVDPNDVAIAALDSVLYEIRLDGEIERTEQVAAARSMFQLESATPNQRIHFHSSLLDYEIYRDAKIDELAEHFSRLHDALLESDNERLVANALLRVALNLHVRELSTLHVEELALSIEPTEYGKDYERQFLIALLEARRYEVLERMLELGIETPVVVMSGFSQLQLDEFLSHPLVVAVVRKPFRLTEIRRALSKLPVSRSNSQS